MGRKWVGAEWFLAGLRHHGAFTALTWSGYYSLFRILCQTTVMSSGIDCDLDSVLK